MKILQNVFAPALIAVSMVACNSAPEESVEVSDEQAVTAPEEGSIITTYTAQAEGDEVMWKGYNTYSDGEHYGTIQVSEGTFEVADDAIEGGSFTIDMGSIHSVDLDGSDMYPKLVGHLKSPDFFAVDSFPTSTFQITKVVVAPESDTTNATHHVSGNLTMRGITKNITIPATVAMENGTLSFETPEFVIDRSKWNVRFRSTSFAEFADVAKDKLIDNNMVLKVDLDAKKS